MKKKKKIIIVTIIIIILLALIYLTINYFKRITYDPEKPYQTVKEAVKALGHEYIGEKESEAENFNKDIYVTFSVGLYTEGKSNQNIYNDLIYTIAKVEKYKSFRLIDTEKEILINVLANEQEKKLTRIYINGDDNYYGRQESLNTIDKYEETPVTELNIQSSIIQDLIKTNWSTKVNFGTEDSKMNGYKIYFDEGIEVKNVDNKVFNVVFKAKYDKKIVNEIKVGDSFTDIINVLGNPTFGSNNEGIIGYKGEKIYIFFMEKEISIYPVKKEYDTDAFIELVTKYTEEGNTNDFINKLTSLWSDYDLYKYDTNSVNLRYSLKGIEVKFNITENHGITFYQNYIGQVKEGINFENLNENKDKIPKYTYFELNTDLVYKTELERFEYFIKKEKSKERLNPYDEEEINNLVSKEFSLMYDEKNGMLYNIKFISIQDTYPNTEIKESINDYIWKDDFTFIYSIFNEGIYKYDVITKETEVIKKGNEQFKLNNIENNILSYDNKKIDL